MEKILLTRSGYEKLVRELDFLSRVERPQIVQEILEAAQEGIHTTLQLAGGLVGSAQDRDTVGLAAQ